MGKEEIDNFFCLIGDIRIFILQKCLLSSPLCFIQLLFSHDAAHVYFSCMTSVACVNWVSSSPS